MRQQSTRRPLRPQKNQVLKGHRDTETQRKKTFNAEYAKAPIVRPGPQSGPRNGASRENAKRHGSMLCVFAARSVSKRGRLRRPLVARSFSLCLCVSVAKQESSITSIKQRSSEQW